MRLDVDVVRNGLVIRIGHADLLAHVDERRPSEQMDDGREHGGGFDAVPPRVAESVDGAGLVVVVPEQRA